MMLRIASTLPKLLMLLVLALWSTDAIDASSSIEEGGIVGDGKARGLRNDVGKDIRAAGGQSRDLAATPTIALTLVNSVTKQDIYPMPPTGQTIDLSVVGVKLTMRADSNIAGSYVAFYWDSALTRVEKVKPFTLAGEQSSGQYNRFPKLVVPGNHTVKVVAYNATKGIVATFESKFLVVEAIPPTAAPSVAPSSSAPTFATRYLVDAGSATEDPTLWKASRKDTYTSAAPIAGTYAPYLESFFQSHRWARAITYTFPNLPPSAAVKLTLGFAEVFPAACTGGVGSRIMNILVNGAPFVSNLDVLTKVPCNTAYFQKGSFQATSQGKLVVQFNATVQNAFISLIDVTVV